VAVDGVCLTATGVEGAQAGFDAVRETLGRTTLGGLRPGDAVNLERALRLSDGLDGHLVQGHVDGLAECRDAPRGEQGLTRFACPETLCRQMVPKGSVALAGVSLTLVDVTPGAFSVAIIPTTAGETTLGRLRPGDRVNVEVDLIGKYVRKAIAAMLDSGPASPGGLSVEKLRRLGW
jgi:riboflavin synthase